MRQKKMPGASTPGRGFEPIVFGYLFCNTHSHVGKFKKKRIKSLINLLWPGQDLECLVDPQLQIVAGGFFPAAICNGVGRGEDQLGILGPVGSLPQQFVARRGTRCGFLLTLEIGICRLAACCPPSVAAAAAAGSRKEALLW